LPFISAKTRLQTLLQWQAFTFIFRFAKRLAIIVIFIFQLHKT